MPNLQALVVPFVILLGVLEEELVMFRTDDPREEISDAVAREVIFLTPSAREEILEGLKRSTLWRQVDPREEFSPGLGQAVSYVGAEGRLEAFVPTSVNEVIYRPVREWEEFYAAEPREAILEVDSREEFFTPTREK